MATIGVIRETASGERRVALVPADVGRLRGQDHDVVVESKAGVGAWHEDEAYASAGARVADRSEVYADSDVILCLRPPDDLGSLHSGQTLIGLLAPLDDPSVPQRLAAAGVTALSFDLLPRTLSRAQAMDALTSQANVAGYKAALVAADAYGGFLPMLVTAAGTTRPARVLVLGAGIAGLQAIATARRLGAVVTGYDVRAAARADIASTGASVLDLSGSATAGGLPTGDSGLPTGDSGLPTGDSGLPTGDGGLAATGEGGYARRLTDEEAARQQRALDDAVAGFDIVITAAQVPGGRSPLLVSERALARLRPGAVVVDVGGNVAQGNAGGVTVIRATDLAARVPEAASAAYSRNVCALLATLPIRPEDEVHAAMLISHAGVAS
jgi:NAD(P) transhydrogenase subunit alpha